MRHDLIGRAHVPAESSQGESLPPPGHCNRVWTLSPGRNVRCPRHVLLRRRSEPRRRSGCSCFDHPWFKSGSRDGIARSSLADDPVSPLTPAELRRSLHGCSTTPDRCPVVSRPPPPGHTRRGDTRPADATVRACAAVDADALCSAEAFHPRVAQASSGAEVSPPRLQAREQAQGARSLRRPGPRSTGFEPCQSGLLAESSCKHRLEKPRPPDAKHRLQPCQVVSARKSSGKHGWRSPCDGSSMEVHDDAGESPPGNRHGIGGESNTSRTPTGAAASNLSAGGSARSSNRPNPDRRRLLSSA